MKYSRSFHWFLVCLFAVAVVFSSSSSVIAEEEYEDEYAAISELWDRSGDLWDLVDEYDDWCIQVAGLIEAMIVTVGLQCPDCGQDLFDANVRMDTYEILTRGNLTDAISAADSKMTAAEDCLALDDVTQALYYIASAEDDLDDADFYSESSETTLCEGEGLYETAYSAHFE